MKKRTREYYDWHEIVEQIEKKHDVDLRDYAKRHKRKPGDDYPTVAWAKKHGYDYTVLDGNLASNSPEMKERIKINKLYEDAPDGAAAEPPYLDFWHYVMDHVFYEIHNGCVKYFDPWGSKEEAQEDNKDGELDWVIEIFDLFIQHFEENGIRGEIEVWIDW